MSFINTKILRRAEDCGWLITHPDYEGRLGMYPSEDTFEKSMISEAETYQLYFCDEDSEPVVGDLCYDEYLDVLYKITEEILSNKTIDYPLSKVVATTNKIYSEITNINPSEYAEFFITFCALHDCKIEPKTAELQFINGELICITL